MSPLAVVAAPHVYSLRVDLITTDAQRNSLTQSFRKNSPLTATSMHSPVTRPWRKRIVFGVFHQRACQYQKQHQSFFTRLVLDQTFAQASVHILVLCLVICPLQSSKLAGILDSLLRHACMGQAKQAFIVSQGASATWTESLIKVAQRGSYVNNSSSSASMACIYCTQLDESSKEAEKL